MAVFLTVTSTVLGLVPFFFDGEKVRDTIASAESKDYLINAVNDISDSTANNPADCPALKHCKFFIAKIHSNYKPHNNDWNKTKTQTAANQRKGISHAECNTIICHSYNS